MYTVTNIRINLPHELRSFRKTVYTKVIEQKICTSHNTKYYYFCNQCEIENKQKWHKWALDSKNRNSSQINF
jgi:hypothetical protein